MKMSTRIRTARLRAGLSQAEVAAQLGVSRAAVSNWESNASRVRPSSQRLEQIALLTGVAWEWLATGRGHASPSSDHVMAVDAEWVEEPIERRMLQAFRAASSEVKQALLLMAEATRPERRG